MPIWPGHKFEEVSLKKLKYIRKFLTMQIYLNRKDFSTSHWKTQKEKLTFNHIGSSWHPRDMVGWLLWLGRWNGRLQALQEGQPGVTRKGCHPLCQWQLERMELHLGWVRVWPRAHGQGRDRWHYSGGLLQATPPGRLSRWGLYRQEQPLHSTMA